MKRAYHPRDLLAVAASAFAAGWLVMSLTRADLAAPAVTLETDVLVITHEDTSWAKTYCETRGLTWVRLETAEGGRQVTVICEENTKGGNLPIHWERKR